MTKKEVYNNKGELLCNQGKGHDFINGLCQFCFCPETPEDQARAENAIFLSRE
jgi:hypothetical protein